MLNNVGLLYDVIRYFFHAAAIYGYATDNIEIPLSDSPKSFQLPGKMAAQALRYIPPRRSFLRASSMHHFRSRKVWLIALQSLSSSIWNVSGNKVLRKFF